MADIVITIPNELVSAIELLIDNDIEFIKPSLLRQVLYVLAGKIPGPSDLSFTADPPLNYDLFSNKFTIAKVSDTNDGYLSKEDFSSFKAGLFPKVQISAAEGQTVFNIGTTATAKAVFREGALLDDSEWSQTGSNITTTFAFGAGERFKPI